MKSFQNLSVDLAEEVIYTFFLFIALAAILFNGAEPFEHFDRGLAKQYFCGIISKSVHQFSRRNC